MARRRAPRDFDWSIAPTQAALAVAFGVHRRTVVEWVRQGAPRRLDSTFAIAEVLAWRIERKRLARERIEADRRARDEQGAGSWAARRLRAEALRREFELEGIRSRLLRPEAVRAAWSSRVGLIGAGLRALADHLRRSLRLSPADGQVLEGAVGRMLANYSAGDVVEDIGDRDKARHLSRGRGRPRGADAVPAPAGAEVESP